MVFNSDFALPQEGVRAENTYIETIEPENFLGDELVAITPTRCL